jgi:uncharacterized protein (TIGR02271 family)
MANTVVGFFDSASEAQNAVEQLVENGFNRNNIDVSGSSNSTTVADTSYSDGSSATTSSDTHRDSDHDSGNAVTRFFKNLFGGDDDEANRYSTVAERSGVIVTVHTDSDDEAERAADLLDDYGAVNVDERASEYGYSSAPMSDTTSASMSDNSSTTMSDDTYSAVGGATSGASSYDYDNANTNRNIGNTNTVGATSGTSSYDDTNTNGNIGNTNIAGTTNTDKDGVIQVVQEDLQVGKKTVETGGVRVRSRIVSRPVEESIRLREERVTVERTPVNRVINTGDLNTFQEQNIELTETAEIPVVQKEARVVEEVRVTKDATEREETIHDTVRNTEVDVENIEGNKTSRTTGYDNTTGNNNGL